MALYDHTNPLLELLLFAMSNSNSMFYSILAHKHPNLSQCDTKLCQFLTTHLPYRQINKTCTPYILSSFLFFFWEWSPCILSLICYFLFHLTIKPSTIVLAYCLPLLACLLACLTSITSSRQGGSSLIFFDYFC